MAETAGEMKTKVIAGVLGSMERRRLDDDGRLRPVRVPLRADGGIAGWGWWHMTNHIYSALTSLGGTAPRPLGLLEPFYREEIKIEDWLDAHQDPQTGYWGTDCLSPVGKRQAMCGAYHEYILYGYEGLSFATRSGGVYVLAKQVRK